MTIRVWCDYLSGANISAVLGLLEPEVRSSTCALRVLDSMRSGEAIQAALGRRGVSARVEAGFAVLAGCDLLRVLEQGLLCGFDEVWLLTSGKPLTPVPDDLVLTSDGTELRSADAAKLEPVLQAVGAWLILGDGCGLNWATTSERVRDILTKPMPEAGPSRGWFAIRQLFLWGTTDEGLNVFEERIVSFAGTEEEAYAKATKDADDYAADGGFVVHSQMDGYRQDGEALIDGYEVWSTMYQSPLSLEEFYSGHYEKLAYHPPRDLRPARPRKT